MAERPRMNANDSQCPHARVVRTLAFKFHGGIKLGYSSMAQVHKCDMGKVMSSRLR